MNINFKRFSVRAGLSASTILPALLIAGTAHAQVQNGGLEEIIVTARKRLERIQDVPASVTAYSQETLQRNDLSSLERVAAGTPELIVARSSTGSGAQISLRGVGSNFTSIGIEQSVAVIIDGSYYGQGRVINEGLFDLGRLEVLKGPQALFFGKNATAGVISLSTADSGREFEAYARAGYEFRAEELSGEAVISTPLSETLGVRLALKGTKMAGGYFRNLAQPATYTVFDAATFTAASYPAAPAARNQPGLEELIGRLTLKWQPSDRMTATLKIYGSSSKADSSGWNNVPLCAEGQTSVFNNPAIFCDRRFAIYQNDVPAAIVASGLPDVRDGQLYNRYKSWAINQNINYEGEDVTITSITNYNWNRNTLLADYSYESVGNNWATERSSWKAISNETRALTSFNRPINLLVGTYYQATRRNFQQIPFFFGLSDSGAANPAYEFASVVKRSRTSGETLSAYGQAIWKIVPTVELTGGVRYTHETKNSFFNQSYVTAFMDPADPRALLPIYLENVPVAANQSFNNWSPEATLSWKPTSDLTVYGAYKTGYKSGGFSNSSIVGPSTQPGELSFGPERAKGFEGGIKASLLERRLSVELGVYRYTYSGLQVDFFDAQRIAYVTTNAGSSRIKGVELALQAAPRDLPGLTLHATANYNKSRYVRFIGPCYGGQSQAEGCLFVDLAATPATGGALPQFQNLAGRPTANAPLWTASLGADYRQDIGGMKLGLSADARYSSSYYASGFANPVSRQGSYINLDAAIRLATTDNRWELALIGKNLTNRFIITGAYDISFTGQATGLPTAGRLGDQAGSIALPRNVRLQLTWRY